MASKRLVIVGGVGGGASAAARAMRVNKELNVTVFERSPDVSFANCGLPYYIGREITQRSALSLHTADSLKKAIGVTNVRTLTEVTDVDRSAKTVTVKDLKTGGTSTCEYDSLILSPGAAPFVPPVAGIDDERILTLRNLVDMDKIDAVVRRPGCGKVTVIGAGFIGLEMVEQLHRLGKEVTLIERAPAVLPQADVEMSRFLHKPLVDQGVKLVVGDGLKAFRPNKLSIHVDLDSGASVEADAVILCIGVKPDTTLAKKAGLDLSPRGQILVNDHMQTVSDPAVYAVGDAVMTKDMVFPDRTAWVALGNIANMQARIAVDHCITGKSIPYRGSLGTSIVRAFDMTLALAGWNATRLEQAKIPFRSTTITGLDHAGYYPGAEPVTMKITYCPETGRVFGAQAVGKVGVDKRIDVAAMAIMGGMTVEDLSQAQLTYSPPFGSARDVVNVAGLAARNEMAGLVKTAPNVTEGRQLLDVRVPCDHAADPIDGVPHVPFTEVRDAIADGRLNPATKYSVLCNWGKTAYFASRNMTQAGFDVEKIDGGRRMQLQREATGSKPASHM